MCYGGGLQKVNLKAQWSSIVTNEKTESLGIKKTCCGRLEWD